MKPIKKFDLNEYIKTEDFMRDSSSVQSIMNIFADCHSDNGHNTRCLNATVELRAADLLVAVKKALPEGYNCFETSTIEDIMQAILGDRVETDEDAHKILRNYHFRFGREGSPVLYIRCNHRIWNKEFQAISKASKADEISIEPSGELRIWWD